VSGIKTIVMADRMILLQTQNTSLQAQHGINSGSDLLTAMVKSIQGIVVSMLFIGQRYECRSYSFVGLLWFYLKISCRQQ
jgi:hypothetical protein